MTQEKDTSGLKTASPGAQSAASDPSPQESGTLDEAEQVRDMPRSGETETSSDLIDSDPGIALRAGNWRRGPQGVQEMEVWAAADALVAAGQRPTIERVRAHLGGGSPNTVSPMLKRWFATLGPRVVAIQTDGSGPEMAQRFSKARPEGSVPPVVDTVARKIWEVAYAEARLAFEAREAAARAEEEERTARFETKRVQFELQQSTFAEKRDVLTNKLASAQESLRAVQGQLEYAVQSHHQKEHQAVLLKHQLIEAQAAQEGLRRAWTIQKSDWEAATREAKMHAAELKLRLIHNINHWRSAASEALANLLKEQEARVRGEEDFAKALESERSALRDSRAALMELRNELESLRSNRVSSPIQPSLDNESAAVAHDGLQPKTSGDQPQG